MKCGGSLHFRGCLYIFFIWSAEILILHLYIPGHLCNVLETAKWKH